MDELEIRYLAFDCRYVEVNITAILYSLYSTGVPYIKQYSTQDEKYQAKQAADTTTSCCLPIFKTPRHPHKKIGYTAGCGEVGRWCIIPP
jgi:hypothetical protein